MVGDSQPAPHTTMVELGTPGWVVGAPPTFLLFTRVFVRESQGSLCIVSKRSPALSHANAALKAAPCQTDEIVALFRLLQTGGGGRGRSIPSQDWGTSFAPPRPRVLPIPAWGAAGSGSERDWGGGAEWDADGIVQRGGQGPVTGLCDRQGGTRSCETHLSLQLGERVPGWAPRLSAGSPWGLIPLFNAEG